MNRQDDKYLLYRRIYRMRKKNFKPMEIATSLDLPITTVNKVLDQLEHKGGPVAVPDEIEKAIQSDTPYIVAVERSQYVILDIAGSLTLRQVKGVREEMQKMVKSSDERPIALKLTDLESADSSGVGVLVNFVKEMEKKGRKVTLLDPSKEIDEIFRQLKIYDYVPVFGTEIALEEHLRLSAAADGKLKRGRIINY